jgi:uncharacterized membrane protein YidH (DUF202 family)
MLELLRVCGALLGCVLILVGVVLGVDAAWHWVERICSSRDEHQ